MDYNCLQAPDFANVSLLCLAPHLRYLLKYRAYYLWLRQQGWALTEMLLYIQFYYGG